MNTITNSQAFYSTFPEPTVDCSSVDARVKAEAYFAFFAGTDPEEDWCEENLDSAEIGTLLGQAVQDLRADGYDLSSDEIRDMCDAFSAEVRSLRERFVSWVAA